MTRIESVLLISCLASTFFAAVLSSKAAPPVVLFDEGHGQQFKIDGIGPLHLSGLAKVLREQDIEVRSTTAPLSADSLAAADALVISGAFQPITETEIAALREFVAGGGRLAVMLHIGPPVAALLHQLGVAISNGVVQERQGVLDQPINFRITRLESHPLTQGLTGFSIYGGWALLPMIEPVESLAETSAEAWVDLNRNRDLDGPDAVQAFSVMVTGEHGDGDFVIFADDAMFQNRFLDRDNELLARNLARWLTGR